MRLSQPSTKISSHYDAIVIGSGYGGSVAASRLSRAGLKVAVLESGKEFGSKDFPSGMDSFFGTAKYLISYGETKYNGQRYGPSYDAIVSSTISDDACVLVGKGLGGGSVINAAVMMEPEERVFEDPCWPASLKKDVDTGKMDEYIRRAREMLGVVKYPEEKLPAMGKSQLFQLAVKRAGLADRLLKPDLAVNFEATPSNHVGIPQAGTDLSGDFIYGNKSGAKNSTTKNYLPDALRHGAQIFCGIDVQCIEDKNAEGDYTVVYNDVGQSSLRSQEYHVRAPTVVLAAGTLGTTGILLKSKEKLDINNKVGQRFSGNGATIAMVRGSEDTESVCIVPSGHGTTAGKIGVYIDTLLDMRFENRDLSENVLIEESSWTGGLAPPQLNADLTAFNSIGGSLRAAMDMGKNQGNIIPLMVLGHDDADAEIVMSGGKNSYPMIRWKSTQVEDKTRKSQREAVQRLADALGGTFEEKPALLRPLTERCTAHPLGGCAMSDDHNKGAIDGLCRIYRADGSVHAGLLVVDGASIPRSLGCNPALTITAIAERAMDNYIHNAGLRLDVDLVRKRRSTLFMKILSPSGPDVQFSERMKGHLAIAGKWSGTSDRRESIVDGRASNSTFEFSLNISIDSLERFMSHEDDASVCGTVLAPTLSPYPLTINKGSMRLFVDNNEDIYSRQMQYELPMISKEGRLFKFVGHKNMTDQHGINCVVACASMYNETTSLTFSLTEGTMSVGCGLLGISVVDVIKMILSVRGGRGFEFKNYFVGNLAKIYLRAFLPKRTPSVIEELMPLQRDLPKVRSYLVKTQDGFELPVKRYSSATEKCRGVIICIHGLTVDYRIFAVDTIEQNVVEAFCQQGYDVWAVNLRFGCGVTTDADMTLDHVAMYDYPAIFDFIESKTHLSTRKGGIHVYTQCFGGLTFAMSVMGGFITPERVKSLCCSQLCLHMRLSFMNQLKMKMQLPTIMNALGVKNYHAPRDLRRGFMDKLLDWVGSYILPVNKTFRSDCVEQSRINLLFGEMWNPDMMDRATVERVKPMFGSINMTLLNHVVEVANAGYLVNARGENVYMPNIDKLAQIPVTVQYGTANRCFEREAMVLDQRVLEHTASSKGWVAPNGESIHKIIFAEGHGHLDNLFGKTAFESAYPDVIKHFNKWSELDGRPWSHSDAVITAMSPSSRKHFKKNRMSLPANVICSLGRDLERMGPGGVQ